MNKKESLIEKCRELIEDGAERDDIDINLLKEKIDPKTAAAVHYELQYIFLEKEKQKQLREKALSKVVAGGIIMLIALIFTSYTVITQGYISLLLSMIMFYFAWKYLSEGRKELKYGKSDPSKFIKKHKYTPKR